jgi:hypothetical protein
LALLIVMVALSMFVLLVIYARFDPVNQPLPLCVKPAEAQGYAVVACSDPSAEYRVVARMIERHRITQPDIGCKKANPASEKSWTFFRWYRGFYLLCLVKA